MSDASPLWGTRLRAGLAPLLVAAVCLGGIVARASLDEAISVAQDAAAPYVKEGFTVREEISGGDLAQGEARVVRYQLFKGNEYWVWLALDRASAKYSVKVLDADGNTAESERWEKGAVAGIRVVPKRTGSYIVRLELTSSPAERTGYAILYGFR